VKLICSRKDLLKGLKVVERGLHACPASIPVLGNVLLKAHGDGLELWATNLISAIRYRVEAKVEESGAITVPGKLLRQVVSALLGKDVQMETEPSAILAIECAGTRTDIKGIEAEEFPTMPKTPEKPVVELDAAEMSRLLRQSVFAASTRQKDIILSGVLLELAGNELKMVASDEVRLSMSSLELSEKVQEPISIIVPAWALKELGRLVSKARARVSVFVDAELSQVFFRFGEILFISRLIEGTFVDYRNCIPKDEQRTAAVVDTTNFLKAMEAIQVLARNAVRGVARKQANIVHLRIASAEEKAPGVIELSAVSSELGSLMAQLEAQVEGGQIDMAFNGKYLAQALSAVRSEQVELITSRAGATIMRLVGTGNFTYFLMPMVVPGTHEVPETHK